MRLRICLWATTAVLTVQIGSATGFEYQGFHSGMTTAQLIASLGPGHSIQTTAIPAGGLFHTVPGLPYSFFTCGDRLYSVTEELLETDFFLGLNDRVKTFGQPTVSTAERPDALYFVWTAGKERTTLSIVFPPGLGKAAYGFNVEDKAVCSASQ